MTKAQRYNNRMEKTSNKCLEEKIKEMERRERLARLVSQAPEMFELLDDINDMRYQIIDGLKRANYLIHSRGEVHDLFDRIRATLDKVKQKQEKQ